MGLVAPCLSFPAHTKGRRDGVGASPFPTASPDVLDAWGVA